jgi:hypothetical protein
MNPITPHGNVVVNASYDYTQFQKATNTRGGADVHWVGQHDDHRIEKKDMVFRHKGTCKRRRTSYNDPDLHVFAVCNGLEGATQKDVRKNCSFIGVSNTHIDAASQRHASVTIAGMNTITNTGTEPVNPGDKLVWDVPEINDTEKGRRPFKIVTYDTAFNKAKTENQQEVSNCLNRDPRPNGNNAQITAYAFKSMMKDFGVTTNLVEHWNKESTAFFMKAYAHMGKEIDSRVIGTALSKAEGGGPFDILLRHSH